MDRIGGVGTNQMVPADNAPPVSGEIAAFMQSQMGNAPEVPGANGTAPGEGLKPSQKAKFTDVWSDIQAKMGARPQKPREFKKSLDKDDFLKIMITQMKHQDPTKPFEADKLASEIAQITSIEQLQNVNQTLKKLATQNRPLERLAMAQWIGKMVTVDKNRFIHNQGVSESLGFYLAEDAQETTVSVVNELGEKVFEKEFGKKPAGENQVTWDGLLKNGLMAKPGNYTLMVEAKGEGGQTVQTQYQFRTKVVGVGYDGADPVLIVGDANQQTRVAMDNVIQVENDMNAEALGLPGLPGQPQGGKAGAVLSKPALFTFEKGVGSKKVDANQLPSEVREALSKYEQQKLEKNSGKGLESEENEEAERDNISGQAQAKTMAKIDIPVPSRGLAKPEEKGFPNGLSEYSNNQKLVKGGEGNK